MAIKIRLPEHGIFWFLGDNFDQEGAIVPLDQCDTNGKLFGDKPELEQIVSAMLEDSYAHYFPEEGVMRHREKIADRTDIEILDIDGKTSEL